MRLVAWTVEQEMRPEIWCGNFSERITYGQKREMSWWYLNVSWGNRYEVDLFGLELCPMTGVLFCIIGSCSRGLWRRWIVCWVFLSVRGRKPSFIHRLKKSRIERWDVAPCFEMASPVAGDSRRIPFCTRTTRGKETIVAVMRCVRLCVRCPNYGECHCACVRFQRVLCSSPFVGKGLHMPEHGTWRLVDGTLLNTHSKRVAFCWYVASVETVTLYTPERWLRSGLCDPHTARRSAHASPVFGPEPFSISHLHSNHCTAADTVMFHVRFKGTLDICITVSYCREGKWVSERLLAFVNVESC